MRRVERARDMGDDTSDDGQLERAAGDAVSQVGARHEAHREVDDALVLAATVERDDVGCSSEAAGRASVLNGRPRPDPGCARAR